MSATNQTANLNLPIFIGDDKPAWLTDWNGAMTTIDGAVASAQTDITGLDTTVSTQGGQISSLNTTVGNHTTSISTLTDATTHNAGDINTINSLIGNGTPTTTDQTIIGAINELHADQGDLADLTTTNKSSLVNAINEIATVSGAYITKAADDDKTVTLTGISGSSTVSDLCSAVFAEVSSILSSIGNNQRLVPTGMTLTGLRGVLPINDSVKIPYGGTIPALISMFTYICDASGNVSSIVLRIHASNGCIVNQTVDSSTNVVTCAKAGTNDPLSTLGITGVDFKYRIETLV